MQYSLTNPQDISDVPCCPHCKHCPCLLLQGLYGEMIEHGERLIDDAIPGLLTNKQIRFMLYRFATNWIHGFLGKGNQRQIPVCVRGEILDFAPQDDHVYVGFRPSRSSRDESA